jgi:YD repeat-containing protein
MMGLLVRVTQTAWFALDRLQVRHLNSGRLTQTFPAPA